MASYDEMNPTDRRNLFEGLASLSGPQEFCVILVDGELRRDLQKDRPAHGRAKTAPF